MRRLLLCGLCGVIGVLTSCSSPSSSEEPEPEPVNSPMKIETSIPGAYQWDAPEQLRFSASDDDLIVDGSMRFYQVDASGAETTIWNKDFSGFAKTRWDSTWSFSTSRDDVGSKLFLEYILKDGFSDDQEVKRGTRQTVVLESRYVDMSGRAEDFFSGGGLDGAITFSGWRTAPVTNGNFTLSYDMRIDRDSLKNGLYRIVGEFEGMNGAHSSVLETRDGQVLPVRVSEYDPELLYPSRNPQHAEGSFTAPRFPDGTHIVNRGYDESHYVEPEGERGTFVSTTNERLLAPRGFFDETEEYLDQVLDWIHECSGITAEHVRESTSEEEFPRQFDFRGEDQYNIFNGSSQDTPYSLTHASARSQNELQGAYLFLKRSGNVDIENPDEYSVGDSMPREVAEHFGIPTSGKHGLKVADGSRFDEPYWTPEAPQIFQKRYCRPAGSGYIILKGQGLENSSGGYTTFFSDWVAEENE